MRIACISLLFAALPFAHLLDLGYSFFSFEVWATSFLFWCGGALLAVLFVRFNLLFVLSAFAVFAFASVYFIGAWRFPTFTIVAIIFLVIVVMRKAEASVLPAAAAFAVVFSLSNVAVPKSKQVVNSNGAAETAVIQNRPASALLHIILDEQATLAPETDLTYATEVAASMARDYQDRGFNVYPTVRSIDQETYKSLSTLVSLNGDTNNYLHHRREYGYDKSVITNSLFERLQGAGYRLRVYQSNYMDFCLQMQSISCSKTTHIDMGVFETSGLSYLDRVKTAMLSLSRDYMDQSGRRLIVPYRAIAHAISPHQKNFLFPSLPLNSLAVMDQLRHDAANLEPGDAYFAHLLIPHFPFAYGPDCQLKAPEDWAYPIYQGRLQSKDAVETAYWEQSACTHDRIMQILDVIASKPFVTVMIHGDHGARLFRKTEHESVSDNLDTFFVVQKSAADHIARPGIPVLQEVFASEFEAFIDKDRETDITRLR